MRCKLHSRRGFSLTEMAAAILVLVLLALVISAGLPTATRAWRQSVFLSDSEILEDTIDTALSDILRYARYTDEADGTVRFSNDRYSITSGGHFVNFGGRLYLNFGGPEENDADPDTLHLLINNGSYTSLHVENFSLQYDAGTTTYTGSYVIVLHEGALIKNCDFSFRSLV